MKRINLFVFGNVFLIFLSSLLFFVSCGKKTEKVTNEIVISENIPQKNKAHEWFCFSSNGFSKISLPEKSPPVPAKPWTESIRISSASCASTEDGKIQKAYMVVNRLGILDIEGERYELCRDSSLFFERTAGNIVFLNNTPIFSLYKSAFFNNPAKDNQHPFLVQFDPQAKISYPILNCDNLTSQNACEVVDFIWDGLTWFCCIKAEEDSKNIFSYIKWTPTAPLLTLSPVNAAENITIEESDVDSFRTAREIIPFSKSPERVKNLLRGMALSVPFDLTIYTAGGTSPRIYSNVLNDSAKTMKAYGIISQTWGGILFEDGTLYVEGAMDGRRIFRGGKAVAIRLPKLPYGYVYTSFVISGGTLYASWEESDFYMTMRSGFITVDLDKTLYNVVKN